MEAMAAVRVYPSSESPGLGLVTRDTDGRDGHSVFTSLSPWEQKAWYLLIAFSPLLFVTEL